MQSHAKKVKKKSTTATAQVKTEISYAINVEESETENDETDARSVDSEEEGNEEENTKAERKTTKSPQKVNIIIRLFLNFQADFSAVL